MSEARTITRAVVGDHGVAVNTALLEPRHRAQLERGRGSCPFVVEDLGVSKPASVIERSVDVEITVVLATLDPRVAHGVAAAHLSYMYSPTTTVGNPSELLDVHVQQFAGSSPLVALEGHRRRPVAVIESTGAFTSQDALDR